MDGGSSLKVMYEHCFRNLGSDLKARLRESRVPLVGFSREVNNPLGVIDLNVTMGELDRLQTVMMEFAVVKYHSPYNVILGWTRMRSLGALASTMQAMIKFPTANGIATMVTKGETLQECQSIKEAEGPTSLKNAVPPITYQRLVDIIFEGQIGRNLEAYVDDMVIKSKTESVMRNGQDYNSTPKSLEEFRTVPGDSVEIPSDSVISYKRRRQDFPDGIRM
ncbi:hypothetical protein Tco_0299263 [Tanacetum coccineum]